ncbi:MAG: D-alanyl-D-alanine carboxypeptidase [Firmicutes bacterium]|nr:D-alanyl-D-alanine carboxypeptidase [Bacillota bacterium]
MCKKQISLLLCALLLIIPFLICPVRVSSAELDIDAKSCILMEMTTGTVLYEYNADEALPPASVTKIMTILIVMDAIDSGVISSDDIVTVSSYAASMGGSQVYLEEGEEMSVGELLKCVIIASANDAAVALAEYVSGSESAFVERMNERAAELGMTNTHFVNTNGLDDAPDAEEHLTSARDIAIMSCELMTKHPEVTEYTTVWMDTIRNGEFGLTNTNRLIRFYRGATGLKTGSTSKAGFCISATAERDGMQLVAVIMGAATRDSRNEAAKTLLDYGYAYFALYTSGEGEGDPVPVTGGKCDAVGTYYESFSCVLAKGKDSEVTKTITLEKSVSAPVSAGDTVGEVTYTLDGEVIGSVPITAAEDVLRIGYLDIIYRMLLSLIGTN